MLLLCVGCASAEVYKWVDEHGRTHYGDRPVTDGASEVIIRTPPQDPGQARRRYRAQQDLLESFHQERILEQEQTAKEAAERQHRQRNCARARKQQRLLQRFGKLYTEDGKGNRHYLSEAERAREERYVQDAVNHWCR